jgi:hypothetical protein
MSTKTRKPADSGDSATLASLRNYTPPTEPVDLTDTAEPAADEQQVTEVAVPDDPELTAAVERAGNFVLAKRYLPSTVDLVMWIAANAFDTADLNRIIIEQMTIRFANAESADEILDPFGTVKGQDILDRPLWITACTFLESDLAEGFPWYASLVHTYEDTGRSQVITVGGEKLVMQAAAMTRKDGWPQRLTIHKADRPTKAGYYPLELRPVR